MSGSFYVRMFVPQRLTRAIVLFRKCLWWIILVSAPSRNFAPAQTLSPVEYRATLDTAEQLFDDGNLAGVIQTLKPLAARSPGRAEAYHGLGLAYYQLKDFVNTVRHLSVAIKLEVENSAPWKQSVEFLGMAYYFSNRAQDALPLLAKAVTWSDDNSNLRYTLAMSYLFTHDKDNARRTFAGLFQIPPDSPKAFLLTAELMVQEKYLDDAEELVLDAMEREPALPLVSYKLGLIALSRGRYSEAAKHLQKELIVNPGYSNAWHYLGETHIRLGKFKQAIDPLQRAIWLNLQSTRSYILLANVYAKAGRHFVAENALQRALQMAPRDYEAHFQLARIYHKTNRPELATRQMEIANKVLAEGEAKYEN